MPCIQRDQCCALYIRVVKQTLSTAHLLAKIKSYERKESTYTDLFTPPPPHMRVCLLAERQKKLREPIAS